MATANNLIIIQRGNLFYANLGEAVGSEQGGIRPVVIVQNNIGNKFAPTVIVAPITSRNKSKLPTHVEIAGEDTGLEVQSIVLLEQIKVLDKKRLLQKIGTCSEETLNNIDKALMISLGIEINKETVVEDINNYRSNKEEQFDIERARNIASSINRLERFINRFCNQDTTDIEDSIKTHLYELEKYCKYYDVDYRFYYKPVLRKEKYITTAMMG